MGGVAGHMSHLYDNPNLKFSQMMDIFKAAANGDLKNPYGFPGDGQDIPKGAITPMTFITNASPLIQQFVLDHINFIKAKID